MTFSGIDQLESAHFVLQKTPQNEAKLQEHLTATAGLVRTVLPTSRGIIAIGTRRELAVFRNRAAKIGIELSSSAENADDEDNE